MAKEFFWLHIKKSAGITTRALLNPYYVEVDRSKKPTCFIQSDKSEYNDILNNYRVPLGEYQFKRCLFAQKYLYPESWDDMLSFAFAREPVDRCISMFYYLFWKDSGMLSNTGRAVIRYLNTGRMIYSTSHAFDVFLEYAQSARTSDTIYKPLDNHFTTHTAPVWDDVTDADGKVIISKLYRLENLNQSINTVFEECGIEKRIEGKPKVLNKTKRKKLYIPTPSQIRKIEEIYAGDFELYENALR